MGLDDDKFDLQELYEASKTEVKRKERDARELLIQGVLKVFEELEDRKITPLMMEVALATSEVPVLAYQFAADQEGTVIVKQMVKMEEAK